MHRGVPCEYPGVPFLLVVGEYGMGTDPVESAESRRYYRAPELVVDRDMYGPAVDMWSYGCILMELAIGKPPFLGANNPMMVRPSAPRPGRPSAPA